MGRGEEPERSTEGGREDDVTVKVDGIRETASREGRRMEKGTEAGRLMGRYVRAAREDATSVIGEVTMGRSMV